MKTTNKKAINKIFTTLGIVVAIPFMALVVLGVYRTMTDTTPPTVFTITNDTEKTVKIYDCLTHDNLLEPGHNATVQVFSTSPRGASCEAKDDSGEYLGCLFALQPVGEHDTIPVSNIQTNVPSSECGIPR